MNIETLDLYEQVMFNDLMSRGYTDQEAMRLLVTSSEPGERSDYLQEYAEVNNIE